MSTVSSGSDSSERVFVRAGRTNRKTQPGDDVTSQPATLIPSVQLQTKIPFHNGPFIMSVSVLLKVLFLLLPKEQRTH